MGGTARAGRLQRKCGGGRSVHRLLSAPSRRDRMINGPPGGIYTRPYRSKLTFQLRVGKHTPLPLWFISQKHHIIMNALHQIRFGQDHPVRSRRKPASDRIDHSFDECKPPDAPKPKTTTLAPSHLSQQLCSPSGVSWGITTGCWLCELGRV